MKLTPWTLRRLDAVINACAAMLAGEEGEGDAAGHRFEDLQAGFRRLKEERARLTARLTARKGGAK